MCFFFCVDLILIISLDSNFGPNIMDNKATLSKFYIILENRHNLYFNMVFISTRKKI